MILSPERRRVSTSSSRRSRVYEQATRKSPSSRYSPPAPHLSVGPLSLTAWRAVNLSGPPTLLIGADRMGPSAGHSAAWREASEDGYGCFLDGYWPAGWVGIASSYLCVDHYDALSRSFVVGVRPDCMTDD